SDLYAGDAAAADERVRRGWSAMAGSLLLRVQLTRIEAVHLRGRAALALARATPPGARATALAAAPRPTRQASSAKTPPPTAPPRPPAPRAAAGETGPAARPLRRAAEGLASADMALYGAAARYRLGRLLGGDEGRALTDGADAWMRAEGIVRPDRMVDMLAPG